MLITIPDILRSSYVSHNTRYPIKYLDIYLVFDRTEKDGCNLHTYIPPNHTPTTQIHSHEMYLSGRVSAHGAIDHRIDPS